MHSTPFAARSFTLRGTLKLWYNKPNQLSYLYWSVCFWLILTDASRTDASQIFVAEMPWIFTVQKKTISWLSLLYQLSSSARLALWAAVCFAPSICLTSDLVVSRVDYTFWWNTQGLHVVMFYFGVALVLQQYHCFHSVAQSSVLCSHYYLWRWHPLS